MTRQPLVNRRRGKPQRTATPDRTDAAALQTMAADLSILAHPVRLELLDLIARNGGTLCVFDLEEALPIRQPTISHHLKMLREAGLIGSTRRGLEAHYYVNRDAMVALRERLSARLETFEREAPSN